MPYKKNLNSAILVLLFVLESNTRVVFRDKSVTNWMEMFSDYETGQMLK